ncbi:putative secreted protein [Candidatus Protochlamydia naegleriophila]|uniref:Putative secreted protein n=1 Tax=Candidatus Protochlamydia naegleriophila TaxID=389348 RepID=A0A0U5JJM8_9BACT|nr:porin [Candidatus Protochlamydia naegleriophila]CUI18006.1 putative secreted protein [Candidatus Protochlamydia naegleriophila]
MKNAYTLCLLTTCLLSLNGWLVAQDELDPPSLEQQVQDTSQKTSSVDEYLAPFAAISQETETAERSESVSSQADPSTHALKIPIDIYYERGFWMKGGGNTLRIGGDIQVDTRSYLQHSNQPSNFRIRRARIILEGTIQDYFGFLFVPYFFTHAETTFQYAYIETLKPSYARLRFGLFKEPITQQALRSDLLIEFNERSLGVINFIQGEDIGVMLFGALWDEQLEYGIGVFNGKGRELENNSKKEYVGRLVLAPFLNTQSPFKAFYLGISGSTSHQFQDLSGHTFRTGTDTIFWEWEEGVRWDDIRNRWGADFEWLYGSFSLRGEYLSVDWGRVTRGPSQEAHFKANSAYIEACYILTGEKKERFKSVIPFSNFPNGSGAWELAGRYEYLNLDDSSLKRGLAKGTRRVHGFVVGVNLYPNAFMAFKVDWERYFFDNRVHLGKHKIDGESVIITRLQAIF